MLRQYAACELVHETLVIMFELLNLCKRKWTASSIRVASSWLCYTATGWSLSTFCLSASGSSVGGSGASFKAPKSLLSRANSSLSLASKVAAEGVTGVFN